MANVQNSFIKSKLNKDLDARLLPNGEYRDARNVQVSRSEGPNVGSLENVLGNESVMSMEFTGNDDEVIIGHVTDESTGEVYLFATDYIDPEPTQLRYSKDSRNYIIVFDPNKPRVDSQTALEPNPKILVEGSFLNFSTTHEIYHVNLLENLLFWTDNRNQPRKINTDTAKEKGPTYYTTEDSISVAKYNPYQTIELYQQSAQPGATSSYETSMKDVTSKFLPNGGLASFKSAVNTTRIVVENLTGDLAAADSSNGTASGQIYGGATIGIVDTTGAINIIANAIVDEVAYQATTAPNNAPAWTIDITGATFPTIQAGQEIVFNQNPYYDPNFAGDENYLEDRFVRFAYRFKFDDNEYSIFSPFTQIAFIPKQDGYFIYRKQNKGISRQDDQADTFKSTIVEFMENKVDDITLFIPLPFTKTQLGNAITAPIKLKEIEILYKESDGLSVKVIDTIPLADVVSDTIGNANFFGYKYLSKKPTKVLPSNQLTRVYDKIPVRAFSQEISGNRVIYGNFQNKHTPPEFLNYNVGVGPKADFNLQNGTITVTNAGTYNAGATIAISSDTGTTLVGSFISGTTTQVTSVTGSLGSITAVTLSAQATFSAAQVVNIIPYGEDTQTVSKVEYPNHTVKQNRTYQVGVVLSDRYGRQSSVILSNNKELVTLGQSFIGDTIYSAYLNSGTRIDDWPGNALKILFRSIISSSKSLQNGTPGLYNGTINSNDYNPLGWYSYKVVVKQTEQEYYNVYLPGIMAAYPEDQTLELGRTSHTVLINDNINKVPRDLTEVGPDQKQFRSSVRLFGRVQNTSDSHNGYDSNFNVSQTGKTTDQFYTGRKSDTVSIISTVQDLFDYDPTDPPVPNYFPQFYELDSNPLIAKISTNKQIGQISTTNYNISTGLVFNNPSPEQTNPSDPDYPYKIQLKNVVGVPVIGDVVFGANLQEGTTVRNVTAITGQAYDYEIELTADTGNTNAEIFPTLTANQRLSFVPGFANDRPNQKTPGVQYLSVYETEPVESAIDIFWETTTTGTIDVLNNLILNATESAGGLSTIQTTNWDEDHNVNDNIMDSAFTLVDSFGANINPSNIQSVEIVKVDNFVSSEDGGPFNVQTFDSNGPYFELISGGASGFYQIKVKQPYYDNIFFSNNSAVRNFQFYLQATTLDSSGNATTNQLPAFSGGPANIVPSIKAAYKTDGTSPADVIINPPGSIQGSTIKSNRYTSPIAAFYGVNGARNTSLRVQDFRWDLASVKIQGTTQNILNLNYFDISEPLIVTSPQQSNPDTANTVRQNLTIDLAVASPSGGTSPMPATVYEINVVGRDAGCNGIALASTCNSGLSYTFFVDLRVVPVEVKEVEATWQPGNEQQTGNENEAYFVQMRIQGASFTQDGYYIFPGVQFLSTLSQAASQPDSPTITVDEQVTTNTGSNSSWAPQQNATKAYFASTETAVRNLWAGSDFVDNPPNLPNVINYEDSTPNPAFTTYTYEIIV